MKIGISCYPTYGGSGVVASELAMALAEGGDEVHVISYAMPSRLVIRNPRLSFHEVVVPRYPLFEYPPYSLALATKMVEVTHHRGLDLLHVHYAVPNAVSAVLARQIVAPRPLPVVTTLHGTDITLVGSDPSFRETTRYGIAQSDAVTTVSEWLRRRTVEELGVEGPIEVIHNFVDPARFAPGRCGGAPRWAKPGEKIVVHVSNFRPVKRVLDVLRVFHQVHRRLPATRLLMVGDGPDRGLAEQYCRDHGFCDAVTFIGNFPLVEEVLIGADLFLFTSESESFGVAVLEAMAAGVPVVATAAGGIPEVVVDGETGHLSPVGDVAALAEDATALLSDEPARRAMGEAARRRAASHFAESEMVGRYRVLYERVVAAANGRPAAAAAAVGR
ncbi:MAG TPA: N-acetyl-alpha-D-glucosaminyl L-malate synthase BshA [Thermoanaerobaculia bacterium]